MQISISDHSGCTARIVLAGKCDAMGAEVIALPLANLAARKLAVLIDLSGVTFLASKGIHQFVSASKALAHHGGRLILFNPSDMVSDVLTISCLSKMMDIVRSESEAEAALKPYVGT